MDVLDLTDGSHGMWPSISASIEFFGVLTPQDAARKGSFCRELCRLFDYLHEGFDRLEASEKARCGLDGVAAETFLQIDLEKRKIVLDKLFKYCNMDFHLFTELIKILQGHFPECHLLVPALQGCELAREIRRFLGMPMVECVLLKGNTKGRMLMGDAPSFEGILVDTQSHYESGATWRRRDRNWGRAWWAKRRSCGCR
jgi:hypothetical protein